MQNVAFLNNKKLVKSVISKLTIDERSGVKLVTIENCMANTLKTSVFSKLIIDNVFVTNISN